jgi:succinyl-diaminopimelate desuccinylase
LIGRGAYDMKGGLAALMCATRELAAQSSVRVHFVCVSDEETDESARGTDWLVERGYVGDFAITGEPTDLKIGVEAKGVLVVRIEVQGKSAHGSRPWLGDNAVLKAVDVFRQLESLPFARESSDLFDRPSINLGRVVGGDAVNRVPDVCMIDVDIRYLPGQDRQEILRSVEALPDTTVSVLFERDPAVVRRDDPLVRTLARALESGGHGAAASAASQVSIGRDGASDAVSFLSAGVPAVEFGPRGAGHHGPDEWVSIESLATCRGAVVDFVRLVGETLGVERLRIA